MDQWPVIQPYKHLDQILSHAIHAVKQNTGQTIKTKFVGVTPQPTHLDRIPTKRLGVTAFNQMFFYELIYCITVLLNISCGEVFVFDTQIVPPVALICHHHLMNSVTLHLDSIKLSEVNFQNTLSLKKHFTFITKSVHRNKKKNNVLYEICYVIKSKSAIFKNTSIKLFIGFPNDQNGLFNKFKA